MKLDDLHPFVAPRVPDLPIPTIEHHMRRAAHDFFRRTHAWQADLDPITVLDGVTDYEIASPVAGAFIVKVVSAVADDYEYAKAVELIDGVLRFDEDGMPKPGLAVAVRVALAPVVAPSGTWTLPTTLDAYAMDISHGALASLFRMVDGKKADAIDEGLMFADRIKTVGLKVSRAFTRKRLTSGTAAQFF